MKTEIRISGLGGQGVVMAGQILGKTAVYSGKNAVQTQSYGSEARGSVAKSEVIISDGKIGYPQVRKCDVLIAMSQEAADKYLKDLKKNGILIIDSTYIKRDPDTEASFFKIPATEYAEKMFRTKVCANMFMLGVLAKVTDIINDRSMKKAIETTIMSDFVDIDRKAYKKGKELIG